jgi:MFS transporter, PHS family, inorganic phosphate transporter
VARASVLRNIDDQGYEWRVVLAMGSAYVFQSALRPNARANQLHSFFVSSYNLFAINAILPALQYLYFSNNDSSYISVSVLTLNGLVVGQLLFGFLADKYGRRTFLGAFLILVIFSAIGVAQTSDGHDQSMSFLSWILFWRFVTGVGIGAAFPLSAVITAE